MDKEKLKKMIADVIEMDHRTGSMEVCSPLYVARMLNVPLEEVEKCMKEMVKERGDRYMFRNNRSWLKYW